MAGAGRPPTRRLCYSLPQWHTITPGHYSRFTRSSPTIGSLTDPRTAAWDPLHDPRPLAVGEIVRPSKSSVDWPLSLSMAPPLTSYHLPCPVSLPMGMVGRGQSAMLQESHSCHTSQSALSNPYHIRTPPPSPLSGERQPAIAPRVACGSDILLALN
jgi:hypothetical protein